MIARETSSNGGRPFLDASDVWDVLEARESRVPRGSRASLGAALRLATPLTVHEDSTVPQGVIDEIRC